MWSDGKRHLIAYTSRKLKGRKNKFSTIDLEMSAVAIAVNYFKQYLIRRKIKVCSDYSSLQYYKTMANLSSRFIKFILRLLEFYLKILHKLGS